MFRAPFAILTVLALTSASAFAGPVQLTDIAQGSAWFGHLDVDKAAEGKLISALWERVRRDDPKFDAYMKDLDEKSGIDLSKGVHGLTIYGDGSKENAVILLYHSFPIEKLHAAVGRKGKIEESVVDGVTVLKKTKKNGEEAYFSISENGPLVAADSARAVVEAVKAFGGKGLTPGAEWNGASAGRSPVLVMSARVDRLPLKKAQSARIKEMKSATFVVEESGDNLALALRATMTDATAAEKTAGMANGLRTLAASATKDAELSALIGALKVDVRGNMVTLDLPVSMKGIMTLMEQEVPDDEDAAPAAGAPAAK